MKNGRLRVWLAAAGLAALLAACSGGSAGKGLPDPREDCLAWCESAWEEEDGRQVCRDACLEYLQRFEACSAEGKDCAQARACALERVKRTCSGLEEHAGGCQDSARFVHNRMLDLCSARQ